MSTVPSVPPVEVQLAQAALAPRELAQFMEHAPFGLGVPAQNLECKFTGGFANKKDRLAFSRHSRAPAARDRGDSLSVQSQGADRGAIFTVKIPRAHGTMKERVECRLMKLIASW
jgi:hypothetical protein